MKSNKKNFKSTFLPKAAKTGCLSETLGDNWVLQSPVNVSFFHTLKTMKITHPKAKNLIPFVRKTFKAQRKKPACYRYKTKD